MERYLHPRKVYRLRGDLHPQPKGVDPESWRWTMLRSSHALSFSRLQRFLSSDFLLFRFFLIYFSHETETLDTGLDLTPGGVRWLDYWSQTSGAEYGKN